ncbi:hypothetical protein BKH41_06920 [Helicobacter sp. 12S02232-10]|uniref:hypothetical protein n=1 Tax=Helicobacter sp. 12S02232-10 TaxID=1476197 RepID=UPI000BA6BF9B|nr:hypothetical protein [Helicobacter sp. 12S02232-10]PAF47623.1 hypothetical protein BKH41_06920 [Helicobacter sp. 12S02232-10]
MFYDYCIFDNESDASAQKIKLMSDCIIVNHQNISIFYAKQVWGGETYKNILWMSKLVFLKIKIIKIFKEI